jgi:GNAT superfamily N-acetyltransferase
MQALNYLPQAQFYTRNFNEIEYLIKSAQEEHITAIQSLNEEVLDDFFKPTMIREYSNDNSIESLNLFFGKFDTFFESFIEKATQNDDQNNEHILIASSKEDPDKIVGLCAFTKEENSIFIEYLIVSSKLRGKGIGKDLLKKALLTFDDIASCKLHTLARGNDAVHAFYEHLGFTSTKELCSMDECLPNSHILYQLDRK